MKYISFQKNTWDSLEKCVVSKLFKKYIWKNYYKAVNFLEKSIFIDYSDAILIYSQLCGNKAGGIILNYTWDWNSRPEMKMEN